MINVYFKGILLDNVKTYKEARKAIETAYTLVYSGSPAIVLYEEFYQLKNDFITLLECINEAPSENHCMTICDNWNDQIIKISYEGTEENE